jgi:hypothetical protein
VDRHERASGLVFRAKARTRLNHSRAQRRAADEWRAVPVFFLTVFGGRAD